MDKKSVAYTEKTRKPVKQKVVGHEIFKVDNSDFPSLQDISETAKNQNKTLECKQTFFSYSDKLKAPPQERTANIFKFGKDSNDENRVKQSSNQKGYSQNDHSGKNKFQSNLKSATLKNIREPPKELSSVSSEQKYLVSGKSHISKQYSHQVKDEASSSVPISEENTSSAEGWTLYQKHSSTKHKTTEKMSDSPIKTEKFHNFPAKNSQTFNKEKGQAASRIYKSNDSRNASNSGYERHRMETKKEVPYDSQFNKSKYSSTNSGAFSATSNQPTSVKAPHSNSQPYSRNTTSNKSISGTDPKYNHPNNNKPRFAKVSIPEGQVPSNSTPNHKLKQTSQNDWKECSRNKIQGGNIPGNNPSSTSINQPHSASGSRTHGVEHSSEPPVTKTKKKRKSKVKRQAALQTGKIFILTPEAHSKILSQANNSSAKSQSHVTNINDEEEYPELGLGAVSKIQKNVPMKNDRVDLETELPVLSDENGLEVKKCDATGNKEAFPNGDLDVKSEDVINSEAVISNVPVHSGNQITVSLFDMLLTKKSKKKEAEEKILEEEIIEHSPVKIRTKKVMSQPVNPLASSKPTVKRGKEREQPKPKKPSKMRKLILMDRQMKKENKTLKESETQLNDPCDTDTDTLSDGSTLSPTKSAIYENSRLNDSPSVNSISHDPISMTDCKHPENCLVLENTPSLSSLKHINSTVETASSINYSANNEKAMLDNHHLTDVSINSDISHLLDVTETNLNDLENCKAGLMKMLNCSKKLENVNMLVNSCSIEEIRHETFIKQEPKFVKSSLEVYNSSLVEPTKGMQIHSKSIEEYCTKLASSILTCCLSEIKILKNDDFDATIKATSDSLPENKEMVQSAIHVCSLPNALSDKDILEKVVSNEVLTSCENLIPRSATSGELKEEIASDAMRNTMYPDLNNSPTQIKTELNLPKFSNQEKLEAAKILIHTRRFRDYCTHFVTKELDETVFSLIDDLARFQDRMHQKDPVKARIKRRLLYGIKEIKKHLALKKLKCIIIATDIEDIKTQGGLNDLLREILSLSEAYHIPYVFSHKRFNLGKVCRKPAPVSCVGILNYEGSEKNFKRMLELKEENQLDYNVIITELVQMLTDDHIQSLHENVEKSIVPHEISKLIMKELFNNDLIGSEINETVKIKLEPKVLPTDTENVSITNINRTLIEKLKNSNVTEKLVNNVCSGFDVSKDFGTSDCIGKAEIYTILKKYNVFSI